MRLGGAVFGAGGGDPAPPRDVNRTVGFFDPVLDRDNVNLLVSESLKEAPSAPLSASNITFSAAGAVASNNTSAAHLQIEDGDGITIPSEWYLQFEIQADYFNGAELQAEALYGLVTDGGAGAYGFYFDPTDDKFFSPLATDTFKTEGEGASWILVTVSNSNARGAELFLDRCLRSRDAKWTLGAGAILNIGGRGGENSTAIASPLTSKMRNFLFMGIPYTPGTATEMVQVGDSFTKWGDHDSGRLDNDASAADDTDNDPFYVGYGGNAEVAFNARYNKYNRTTAAVLTGEAQKRGHYVPDAGIRNYGRGATVIDPSLSSVDFRPLSESVDAALDEGTTDTPPGGTSGRAKIWFVTCGSNDFWRAAVMEPSTGKDAYWNDIGNSVIAAAEAQIDRMLADGADQIIWTGPAFNNILDEGAFYNRGAVLDVQMSALASYDPKVSYASIYFSYGTSVALRDPGDTIHPNGSGMALMGETVALYLEDLEGGTVSGGGGSGGLVGGRIML